MITRIPHHQLRSRSAPPIVTTAGNDRDQEVGKKVDGVLPEVPTSARQDLDFVSQARRQESPWLSW